MKHFKCPDCYRDIYSKDNVVVVVCPVCLVGMKLLKQTMEVGATNEYDKHT